LTSDVIGLETATSPQAEAVLRDARRLLRTDSPSPDELRRVNASLLAVLPEMDPFLVRWRLYVQQHGGEAAR
jgi:hypothetical protein